MNVSLLNWFFFSKFKLRASLIYLLKLQGTLNRNNNKSLLFSHSNSLLKIVVWTEFYVFLYIELSRSVHCIDIKESYL